MRTFIPVLCKQLCLRYHVFNAFTAACRNLWWLFLKLEGSHLGFYYGSGINKHLQWQRNYLVEVDFFSLGTLSEAVRQNLKILYQATSKRFRVFKDISMLDGLILFRKGDFRSKVCL